MYKRPAQLLEQEKSGHMLNIRVRSYGLDVSKIDKTVREQCSYFRGSKQGRVNVIGPKAVSDINAVSSGCDFC